MPSFGENLRREREKRKITLDQISQSTKIGTRMLQALEEDRFNQLPGGIFNKGFVRAYARTVGLDEEQTVADYLQASGESAPVMPEMPAEHPAPRIVEASAETPERPLPWGLLAALLLVAALALSLWSHRQTKQGESFVTPPAPSQPARPSTESAKAPSPANPAPAAQTANVRAANPALTASPASGDAAVKVAPAGAAPSPATAAPVVPAGFAIRIEAREDSWTRITSDGKTVYDGLLSAGDDRSIRGQREVIVRAGNAGGVDLFFNGKKLPPAGEYGEIKTVTFGPAGLLTNTQSPPSPQ